MPVVSQSIMKPIVPWAPELWSGSCDSRSARHNPCHVPALAAGVDQRVELGHVEGLGRSVAICRYCSLGAVHADYVEERLAVDVEPRQAPP